MLSEDAIKPPTTDHVDECGRRPALQRITEQVRPLRLGVLAQPYPANPFGTRAKVAPLTPATIRPNPAAAHNAMPPDAAQPPQPQGRNAKNLAELLATPEERQAAFLRAQDEARAQFEAQGDALLTPDQYETAHLLTLRRELKRRGVEGVGSMGREEVLGRLREGDGASSERPASVLDGDATPTTAGLTPSGSVQQTSEAPILTRASRSNDIVFLSFDGMGRVPSAEEIEKAARDGGHRVSVNKFQTNIISGTQGNVAYRIDVMDADGNSSKKAAEAFYRDLTGGDASINNPSQFEQKGTLGERFKAAHAALGKSMGEGPAPKQPGKVTAALPPQEPTNAEEAPQAEVLSKAPWEVSQEETDARIAKSREFGRQLRGLKHLDDALPSIPKGKVITSLRDGSTGTITTITNKGDVEVRWHSKADAEANGAKNPNDRGWLDDRKAEWVLADQEQVYEQFPELRPPAPKPVAIREVTVDLNSTTGTAAGAAASAPAADPIDIRGDEIDTTTHMPTLRASVKKWAREHGLVGKKYKVEADGREVAVSLASLKHAMERDRPEAARVVARLPDIIRRATPVGKEGPKDGSPPDLLGFHTYRTSVRLAGEDRVVELKVKELSPSRGEVVGLNVLYTHQVKKPEGPFGHQGASSGTPPDSAPTASGPSVTESIGPGTGRVKGKPSPTTAAPAPQPSRPDRQSEASTNTATTPPAAPGLSGTSPTAARPAGQAAPSSGQSPSPATGQPSAGPGAASPESTDPARRPSQGLSEGPTAPSKPASAPSSPTYTPRPDLDERQRKVEDEIGAVIRDTREADRLYDEIDGAEGGKVIATDLARELSPTYRDSKAARLWAADGTANPARAYSRDRLMRDLANPPTPADGTAPVLLITGGSPGSGKSTSVKAESADAEKVWDNQLSNFDEAVKVIEHARDHGWLVRVRYVTRPFEESVSGVLDRAQEHKEGRPVLVKDVIASRLKGQEVIAKLAEKYGGDDWVMVGAVLNSKGVLPRAIPVSDVAPGGKYAYTEEQLRSDAHAAIRKARAEGIIPAPVLAAVEGDFGQGEEAGRGGAAGAAEGSERGEQEADVGRETPAANAPAHELLETEFVERSLAREVRQYERGIKDAQGQLDNMRLSTRSKRLAASIAAWQKHLDDLRRWTSEGVPQKQREAYRDEYVKAVKKAISTGKTVRPEIIAQYPEFTKAVTARARYDKGVHTSFANRSVAVNESMKAEGRYKVKRQDGKPITPKQIDEIKQGVKDVEAAVGSLTDLLAHTDPTFAHTSGKHPFMNDAGGLYSPHERTITIGIKGILGDDIKTQAHEMAHWLDYEAGAAKGLKSRVSTKSGKSYTVSATSEASADFFQRDNPDLVLERDLIAAATSAINGTMAVRKLLLKPKDPAKLTVEQKAEIEFVKVKLGHYWRQPREVFARLFEQYVANKLGRASKAAFSPEEYTKLPGWWTQAEFDKLAPQIEKVIAAKIAGLREAASRNTKGGAGAGPAPGRASRALDTLEDRLGQFADERRRSFRRRMSGGPDENGIVWYRSGLDLRAAYDMAAWFAAAAVKAQIRGGRALTKFVRERLAEARAAGTPVPADEKRVRAIVKAYIDDAGGESATEERVIEVYERGMHDIEVGRARLTGRNPKATIAANAGLVDSADAKSVSERDALKAVESRAAKAALSGYAAGRRREREEAVLQLDELRQRLTDKARRQRQIDRIKNRGEKDEAVAREAAKRRIEKGVRREAVEIIRQHLPRVLWGNYLTDIRDATTTLRLAKLLRDVQHDLAEHNVRVGIAAAEKAIGSEKSQLELEPELREEFDKAVGALDRIKRALRRGGVLAEPGSEAERAKAKKRAVEEVRRDLGILFRKELPESERQPFRERLGKATTGEQVAAFLRDLDRDGVPAGVRSAIPKLREDLGKVMLAGPESAASKLTGAAGATTQPKASRPTLEEMQLMRDELEAVANAVMGARFQQKTLDQVRIRGELRDAKAYRVEMASTIEQSGKELAKGDSPQEREANRFLREVRKRTNWDVMMRMLDGFKTGGPAVRLFQQVLRSRRRALELDQQFRDKLGEIATRHGFKSLGSLTAQMSGTLGRALQKHVSLNIAGFDKLTLGQAAYIYAMSSDQRTLNRIRHGQPFQFRDARTDDTFNLTQEDLAAVAAALPANIKAYVDEAKALYDSHYFDRLSAVNKRLKGYHLKKVAGYWGYKLNRDFAEMRAVPTAWHGNYIRALEESGFMQETLGPSSTPILIGDFGSDIILRSKSAASVVGKAETTKLLSQTLLHKDVVTHITKRFGVDTVERLKRRVALFSGGEIYNPGEKLWRRLMSLWARGKTQLWGWTWLRNMLSGSMRVMNELGITDLAKAGLAPSWGMWQRLKAASPELRERWEGTALGGYYDAGGKDVGGATFKEAAGATVRNLFDAIKAIETFDPRRLGDSLDGALTSWSKVLDAVQIGNFFDACGAIIAFKHFLKKAPPGLSSAEKDRWAARHATRVFERVSNTGTIEYSNDIQIAARDHFWTASLTPFTGDTAKAISMVYEAAGKAKHNGDWKAVARVATALITGSALSAMVSMLRGVVLGDDEEKVLAAGGRRFVQEMASLAPGGTVLSKGATKVFDKLTGNDMYDPSLLDSPILELANETWGGLQDIWEGVEREGKPLKNRRMLRSADLYLRGAERIGTTALEALGIPAGYGNEYDRFMEGWFGDGSKKRR